MAQGLGRAVSGLLPRHQEPLVFWGMGAMLITVSFLPLLWPAAQLLGSPAGLEVILDTLGTARQWVLLGRSLALAGAVTLVASLLGTALGLLLARTDVPGRRVILLIHGFPLFLPPFLLALGWFYLFGRQGLLGGELSTRLLFSEPGLVAVLALAFTPVVTALVALGLWGIEGSLEEAARVVAGPWRVATRILLPAVWPSITLGAIVVFALALSELGVPMFLRVDVYPAAVFARLGGIDYAPGEALALALPLIPIALALLVAERRLAGRRSYTVLGLGGGARAPLPLGRWRMMASAACWVAAALSMAPIAALALRAQRGGGFAAAPEWIGTSLGNSLMAGGLAATGICLMGLVTGHGVARRRAGAAVLDALSVLAFLTPAVLLGIGLIALWNRPATAFLYGGIGMIVVGYMGRYAVVGLRTLTILIAQSSPHLEESAAAAGAGYLRRLLRIVAPLHWRGILAAWLLALVFCLRDLETAVLFYPPGGEPLTVRIFTLEANGPEAVVAALAVVQTAVTAAALAIGALALQRNKAP